MSRVFAEQMNLGTVKLIVLGELTIPATGFSSAPDVTVFKTISLAEADRITQEILFILAENGWNINALANDVIERLLLDKAEKQG